MNGSNTPGKAKDTLKAARLQVQAVVAPSDGVAELGALVNGLILVLYAGMMWLQAGKWQPTGFGILVLAALAQGLVGLFLLFQGFRTPKRKWLTYGPGFLLNVAALGAIGFFLATGSAG